MEEQKFLGTGVKFPPQVNKATGRFLLSEGAENVKESLYIILMTQKGERFTRPEFGSRILSGVFMDASATMRNMMARDIQETILRQEPRIAQAEVYVRQDREQRLLVDIRYQLRDSDIRDNLVFPFFLQ